MQCGWVLSWKKKPKRDLFFFVKKGPKRHHFLSEKGPIYKIKDNDSYPVHYQSIQEISKNRKYYIIFYFSGGFKKRDQVSEKGTKKVRFQPISVISPKKGPVCFFRDQLNHTANEMIWVWLLIKGWKRFSFWFSKIW